MIIAISGSVGSGKTSLSKILAKELGFDLIHLNDVAKDFRIDNKPELQTFDFDIDALLDDLEKKIKDLRKQGKDVIIESHFAHFINPNLVDYLFIINRNLKDLKSEYKRRGYNKKKIEDNLEVEAFNLCFYEALENGYEEEKQVFCFDNEASNQKILIEKIKEKIREKNDSL